MNFWLLRLHRWTTLVFSIPLAVIVLTGLILSFEPLAQRYGASDNSLSAPQVKALLQRYDPEAKATRITLRPYDNSLEIAAGRGAGAATIVDLSTGDKKPALGTLASLFGATRGLHEHLLGLGWLVITSTLAMLALMIMGVLMGLPRLMRNNLSGWHKGFAWFSLPLIVLSPLTALFMAGGLTFGGALPAAPASAPRITTAQAVDEAAKVTDVSRLQWIRVMGPRVMMRYTASSGTETSVITAQGAVPASSNWPRAFHEGLYAGPIGAVLNVLISIVLIGLMTTGLLIWKKRTFRKRPVRAPQTAGLASHAS